MRSDILILLLTQNLMKCNPGTSFLVQTSDEHPTSNAEKIRVLFMHVVVNFILMQNSREGAKPSPVLSKEDEVSVGTSEQCVKIRRQFYTDSTCRGFITPHSEIK